MTPLVQETENKVRLQVELIPSQVAALNRLMVLGGFSTRKELVNNALTLFEWALNEASQGNEIASLNKDRKRYEVLRMPALMNAQHHSKNNKIEGTLGQTRKNKTEKENSDHFVPIGAK